MSVEEILENHQKAIKGLLELCRIQHKLDIITFFVAMLALILAIFK